MDIAGSGGLKVVGYVLLKFIDQYFVTKGKKIVDIDWYNQGLLFAFDSFGADE